MPLDVPGMPFGAISFAEADPPLRAEFSSVLASAAISSNEVALRLEPSIEDAMHKPPRHQIDLLKKTAVDWIAEKRFDLLVTLAFNDGRAPVTGRRYFSPLVQRDRLREWDARVNHMLLGSAGRRIG